MVQLILENLYFTKTSNISKTRADREKLMADLKSAHQIYIKSTTNTPAPKCVLTSVIKHVLKITKIWAKQNVIYYSCFSGCYSIHFTN